jgi:hypothetical protein
LTRKQVLDGYQGSSDADSLVDYSPKVIGLLAEVKKRYDLLKAHNTQTIDSFAEPSA